MEYEYASERKKERKIVSIFWTGGYDSTFRIVQLSRCNADIQPIYISDNRKCEANELKAIEDITRMLKEHPGTIATFRPLKFVSKAERENDKEFNEAYLRISSKDYVGSQYVWLGCYAQKNDGIEMSIHRDDKAINIIQKYGRLKKVTDEVIGDYYVIDEHNSPADIVKLWGFLRFPLVDYTKLQMKEFYNREGYDEIANATWFCHTPRNGKPCGTCAPCRYTINEGLKERFTSGAIIRYYCFNNPITTLLKKIIHCIRH